jgi:hypothetical protein
MVVVQVIIEQANLFPDTVKQEEKHDGIARDRSSGPAEADDDVLPDFDVNDLLVRHSQSLSTAWDVFEAWSPASGVSARAGPPNAADSRRAASARGL